MSRLKPGTTFLLLVLLAGCSTGPAPSVAPASSGDSPSAAPTPAAPTAAAPTASAAPTVVVPVRPSPYPGAPVIADPYWLSYAGHDTSTWKDAKGSVTRTDEGEAFQVIDGGSVEGTILVNGTFAGNLEITTTTGNSGGRLSPIEEQYFTLIDSKRPKGYRGPNKDWTYRTGTWGSTTVYVRDIVSSRRGPGIEAVALWWVKGRSTWAMLQVDGDTRIDDVLAALLGPTAS